MKALILAQLLALSFANAQNVYNTPTVLTGNQKFSDEVVINDGGALTLNDGSEYIFDGGFRGAQQCFMDITAAKDSPFTLTFGSNAKEFDSSCAVTINNPNTGPDTVQTINISPPVFKNSNKFILNLAHTSSDANSKIIIGSPDITNTGEINYISTGGEIHDPNELGNVLQIGTPSGSIQNVGTISLNAANSYYLFGKVSGKGGKINVEKGVLQIDSASFTDNVIHLSPGGAISLRRPPAEEVNVSGLGTATAISSIGKDGKFEYDSKTGLLSITTSEGVYKYNIGCGYNPELASAQEIKIYFQDTLYDTFSFEIQQAPPTDSKCEDIPPIEPSSVKPSSMNPSSVNPSSMNPSSMNPSSMNPSSPSSINPSSMNPSSPSSMNPPFANSSSMNPSSMNPSSMNPSSMNPSSMNPSSMNPSSVNPSSVNPSVEPSILKPSNVNPSSFDSSSMNPSSVNPSSVNPSSMSPSSVNPSSVKPSSVKPSSDKPSNANPSSVKPSSINPSVEPSILKPSNVNPSSFNSSGINPSSVNPSSVKPSVHPSVKPSSEKPSNVNPTSVKPSSVKPSSASPSSAHPSNISSKPTVSVSVSSVSNKPASDVLSSNKYVSSGSVVVSASRVISSRSPSSIVLGNGGGLVVSSQRPGSVQNSVRPSASPSSVRQGSAQPAANASTKTVSGTQASRAPSGVNSVSQVRVSSNSASGVVNSRAPTVVSSTFRGSAVMLHVYGIELVLPVLAALLFI